ncbi:ExbD/TolR family protein [Thiococcus pfennigii]|uniref:ExbD/TolR family protein n=1 Tax=Thiococcus pfennigii TaxID=1057 RepID=UPI001902C236|nr:biopolymer transporter ExbD [Thiococcus pfennigii]MBK1700712.1 hypothetical protein [Thiococcus pfennigii]MBK1730340.1 hypothetical protein [Thiococcus pfennigii]
MKLISPVARRRQDDHLIPLINIIFLMLIFFMVVGRVAPSDPFPVEPPASRHGDGASTEERVLLIGADGRLALDGEVLDPATLGARLAAWSAENRAADRESPGRVTIKADAGVRSGHLRQTLDTLRAAGVARVTLLTARAG